MSFFPLIQKKIRSNSRSHGFLLRRLAPGVLEENVAPLFVPGVCDTGRTVRGRAWGSVSECERECFRVRESVRECVRVYVGELECVRMCEGATSYGLVVMSLVGLAHVEWLAWCGSTGTAYLFFFGSDLVCLSRTA